jgi:hypothetical protein
MRVLVDTNILLRSAQPSHTLCSQATQAVSKLNPPKRRRLLLFPKHRRILECGDAARWFEWTRVVA